MFASLLSRFDKMPTYANQIVVKSAFQLLKSARSGRSDFRHLALRLVAGWIALLSYAWCFTPVGLGMAALTGSMDPNHQLRVCAGPWGMNLVLHHGTNCVPHHHGALARALTLFAEPASPTAPDHVIQFGTADGLSRKADITPPQTPKSEPLIVALNLTPVCLPKEQPPIVVSGHPPPSQQEQALCLRSTVLRI